MNSEVNNTNNVRILFVDDESNVLDGLRRMLRSKRVEWQMDFVGSGAEALRMMEQADYDVIMSDIRMPGMDGMALLQKIKDNYPHVVRIALSGQSSKESVYRIVGPIHQYLQKPCDAQTLKNTLDHITSLKGLLSNPRLADLIGQMETLPCMAWAYSQLVQELQSPDGSIKKISQIISRDVGMSVRILKLVNSSFFGVRQQITSIPQAVMLLGMDVVKSLVLMMKIFSQFNPEACGPFSYEMFWEHSMMVGQWAQAIARLEKFDARQSDAVMIAGMFHDVGRLVLADKMPDEYQQVLTRAAKQGIPIRQVERDILGTTHAEVGAYLFGLWGFSHDMISATIAHHTPETILDRDVDMASIVFAANMLAAGKLPPAKIGSADTPISDSELAGWKHASRIAAWRNLRPEEQKVCC